jgi:hypothetical protein
VWLIEHGWILRNSSKRCIQGEACLATEGRGWVPNLRFTLSNSRMRCLQAESCVSTAERVRVLKVR